MFENRFAQAQATEVVNLPWGFAVLQDEYPLSQYHNRIVVTSAVRAADVLSAAEEVLGGARVRHRYLSVAGTLGNDLNSDFAAAGYEHEPIMTMLFSGPDVEPAAYEVHTVSLQTLRPALIRDWRATIPDASDELLGQLADRTALGARGAELTLLAVYEGDEIAARAELYVDRAGRIAQFENLVTHEDFRGRGYGRALIRDALRRGRDAGAELFFLTVDLDDWPREWYRRLGFVDAGRTNHFSLHNG